MILEELFIFGLWRVSLAEYILVLRVPFPCCFVDGQMYYGYCIHCLYPAMCHSTSSFAVVGMIKLWHCIRLNVCVCVISKLWSFRYSWTWFVITIVELRCNFRMLWTECNCGWWSCWCKADLQTQRANTRFKRYGVPADLTLLSAKVITRIL